MAFASTITSNPAAYSTDFVPARANWLDKGDHAKCVKWLLSNSWRKDHLERAAARNISYLSGNQFHSWSLPTRNMELPPAQRGRMMLVYNVIRMLVNQRLAKLMRSDPAWNTPALTSDEFDQLVARASNDIMDYYWRDGLRMPLKINELLYWLMVSRLTFVHPCWSPSKGDPIVIPFDAYSQSAPGLSPEAQQAGASNDMADFRKLRGYDPVGNRIINYTGDIDLQIVSIFNAMWYPFWASRDEDLRIFLKSDMMTVDECAVRYGLDVETILAKKKSDVSQSRYHTLLAQYSNPFSPIPLRAIAENNDGIMVHQLYVSRELAPPHGASSITLGDDTEAIAIGTLGNRYGDFPFRSCCEYKVPGQLTGGCTVDDQIGPQTDINLAKTRQAEWRDVMVSPRIVKQKEDGSDADSYLAENKDRIIEVNDLQTQKPQVLYMPPHGVEDENAVAFDLRFMHDSAAVPDVSLGNTQETGARSGIGIRSLQEEAAERLKITGVVLDDIISWAGSFLLGLLQQYAVAPRITPLLGENNLVEYTSWSSASLRPSIYEKATSNVAMVRCSSFTNIPHTPIEARNTLISLMQVGAIRPGEHDNIIADVFGLDSLKTFLDKDRPDRDKQETEIEKWRSGALVGPPALTDNHKVHRDILALWVKSSEGQQIIATNPMLAQDITLHLDGHEQGIYDEESRKVCRQIFANQRVAAEFANRAASAGMMPQAELFLQMSMTGLGAQPMQDDGSGRQQQDKAKGGLDNRPKDGSNSNQSPTSPNRPNNDSNAPNQRGVNKGRDQQVGSNV